jgi:phosphoenolpyruvate carboxykinase (ATP)
MSDILDSIRSQYQLKERVELVYNPSPAMLYKAAILYEKDAEISNEGALVIKSGVKTGRSPKDKRITDIAEFSTDVWWGKINMKMDAKTFQINKQTALDYFNSRARIYVIDGFAGWDKTYRIKIRVLSTRPYHALFMQNMLIQSKQDETETFENPDFVLLNAGEFPANQSVDYMSSNTSIDVCFAKKEFIILGTEYAGEMKKGVFTVLNYLLPKRGVLSMHCAANEGVSGDVTLFFGLSGTGKTTLSADVKRRLIGDDEHGWSNEGIFNIEGGCYAKALNLSVKTEPSIFRAIRFGSILENVVIDKKSSQVDFFDNSLSDNSRVSYPLSFIQGAKLPALGSHPKNIIFLTCDAFGILPPVARLTTEQAMYHFISGYTAKIPGTEMGVIEPLATFSACFGEAFLVWHPMKYAVFLAEKIEKFASQIWLVNTGWVGGKYGVGERINLAVTRSIIDSIHAGELEKSPCITDERFGFAVPTNCQDVPQKILNPQTAWNNPDEYAKAANHLVSLFQDNFKKYQKECSAQVIKAEPIQV